MKSSRSPPPGRFTSNAAANSSRPIWPDPSRSACLNTRFSSSMRFKKEGEKVHRSVTESLDTLQTDRQTDRQAGRQTGVGQRVGLLRIKVDY